MIRHITLITLLAMTLPSLATTDFLKWQAGLVPEGQVNGPDTLDDIWQNLVNGWALDPNGDEDNDGCNNYVESLAGTDPRNPTDCLAVGNIAISANSVVVTFRAEKGKKYQVWESESPTGEPPGGSWTLVAGTTKISTLNGANDTIVFSKPSNVRRFYRLESGDADSDGDGLSDWAENKLGTNPALGSSTGNGALDGDTIHSWLTVTAAPSVPNGFERNDEQAPSPASVPAKISLTRSFGTMALTGIVVTASGGKPSATKSDATAPGNANADYTVSPGISIPANQGVPGSPLEVDISPVQDGQDEVPEFAKISFKLPLAGDMNLPSATVCICDANPSNPNNNELYVAFLGHEAGQATTASGYATAILNGDNTSASIAVVFNNLSSPQNTAYIRYGPNNDLAPALPTGQVSGFNYNVVYKPGFLSTDQAFLTSLKNSDIWCAITSANFSAGEIAGPFQKANGSTTFTPPVNEPDFGTGNWTTNTTDLIERDIWRFMNQSTFGGTTALYNEIRAKVDAAIAGGGSYLDGLEDWMDEQMSLTTAPSLNFRTLVMAADNEEFALRGNKPSTYIGDPQINNSTYQLSFDAQGMPFVPASSTANNNNFTGNYPQSGPNRRREWWTLVLQCKDQLRQRMALALSEIAVISEADQTILDRHLGCAHYWDMLASGAFGKYRNLLEQVTLSPMMGIYLSHMANRATYDAGGGLIVSPDENYAREIMQLFSIGLVLRHPDGSLVLDEDGLPIPTYDQDDITELARVMTGFSTGARHANGYYSSFSGSTLMYNNYSATDMSDQIIENYAATTTASNFSNGNNLWFGRRDGHLYWAAPWIYPMKVMGRISDATPTIAGSIYYHDFNQYVDPATATPVPNVSKRLLAGKHGQYDVPMRTLPPLGRGANDITCNNLAALDLTEAHNALAGDPTAGTYGTGTQGSPGHQNTPVNISRWLIQRLVTSNPSAGYIYRVSEAYRQSNGNLGNVFKAILLDYEARSLQLADSSISHGKVKEPIVAFAQMLRAFRAYSGAPVATLKDNAPPFGSGESPMPEPYPSTEFGKFSDHNANPPSLPNGWATGPFRYRFGDLTGNIGQSPQRAPSVFNWFLPDFVVPGPMAQAGLFAPELQISTEASVVAKVNMFFNFTWSNLSGMVTQPGSDANVADFTLSNAWATPATLFSLDGGKTFVSSLTFDSTNWNTAKTLTVVAADTPAFASVDNSLLRFSVTGAGSGYDALPVQPMSIITNDNEIRNEGIVVEETGFSTWVQEGSQTDTLNIRLQSPPPVGATVTVNIAATGTQASASPASLNFTNANWSTAQVVTVTATDELTSEAFATANDTLTFTTTSATSAWNALTAPSITVNVVDNNDGANSLGILITESNGDTRVQETAATVISPLSAGMDSFNVVLTRAPSASVTVTFTPTYGQLGLNTTQGGTTFSTGAVTRTFTTGNWATAQTVVIRGNDDGSAENDFAANPLHYGAITVHASAGGYDNIGAQTVIVPVNESAFTGSSTSDNQIIISHGGTNAGETRVSEDGSLNDTISVALRRQPTANVVVTLGSGQVSCTPDHLTFTSANYSTPQTVTVRAIDDHFAEGLHLAQRNGTTVANAVQAFATCTISGGAVNATTITARGGRYTTAPKVTFALSPTGVQATGTANLNALGQVTSITITSGGSGYTVAPAVILAAPPNGLPAMPSALCTISSGAVNVVNVTSGGGGFVTPPLVFFGGAPAGGTTATGVTQLNAQGQVSNILVSNPGAGYLTAPAIFFYEPPTVPATIVATATSDNVADNSYNNYWARTHSSLNCTVIDNDLAALVINQSGGSTEVNENGATDTVGLSLSQQPSANVTVTLSPTNQLLIGNTTLPSTLTFTPANWSTAQVVTVAAVNDATVEGDVGSNIGVGITSSDTAFGGLKARAIPVTVIDNDYQPLTVNHTNTWTIVAEGATGGSSASVAGLTDTFTVRLPRVPTANVTVTLLPDANVTVSPSVLTFTTANSGTDQTVTVTAFDDGLTEATNHEAAIRFQINSTDSSYSNNAMYPWPVQVIDNDSFGVAIVQSDLFTTPTETSTDAYTIRLTKAPLGNVVVRATSPNPAELLVNSATTVNFTFTTTNWATPQTLTVTAVGDGFIEGRELFTVTHDIVTTADATNYPTTLPVSPVTVYNADNFRRNEGLFAFPNGGSITVNAGTPNSGTTWVREGGGYMDRYDVYLSGRPINNVIVSIFPSIATGQVAQIGTDKNLLTFTPDNWNVPQTVQVMALDDNIVEPHHASQGLSFQALNSDPLYQFVSNTPTVYIIDNESAAVLIEQSGGTTETVEGGATDTYTITLNREPNGNVVIEPLVNPDTTVSPTGLTFNASNWNVPQTVTVTAFNDAGNERNEVSMISHAINAASTTDTTGFARLLTNCTTIINSGTVTCDSTSGLYVNMPIAGPNIQTSAIINGIVNATTFTMNVGASAAGSGLNLTAGIQAIPNNVQDNDDLVAISHTGFDTRVHEDGTLADSFNAVLRRAPTGGTTVNVTPAVPANQGYAVTPATLSFTAADWSTPKTFNVTGVNNNNFTDRLRSANITFTSTASGGSPNDTSFTIANNAINQIPVFVVTSDMPNVVVSESGNSTNLNEGGAADTVSYILTHKPTSDVTVTITADSQLEVAPPAVAGVLIYGPTTTLTFTPANWDVYQAATFRAKDDLVTESNSLLVPHLGWVTHSATSTDPQYTSLTLAQFPALIIDNEVPGAVLAHTGGNTTIAEGSTTDSYTVVLTRAPTADVTVTISPDVEAAVSPTSLTFTSGNWNLPQSVTVSALQDTDVEGLHSTIIAHSLASADPLYNTHPAPSHFGTVYDDDGNQLVVTQTGGNTVLTEGPDSSGWDTIDLRLSAAPAPGTTVTISLVPPMYYIPPAPYSKQWGYFTSDLAGSNQQKDRIVLDYTEINLLYRSTFYGYLTSVYGSNIPFPPSDVELQNAHWIASKAIVDKLDLWFNGGSLKAKYPTLAEPNQPPPAVPQEAQHARQVLIEAIYYINGGANNLGTTRYLPEIVFNPKVPPVGTFHDEIRDRCRWAGYLMTTVMNGFVAH